MCLSVCLSVCLFIHLSVCLSICLSVCLSVCPSICLSVFLSLCLSVHTSVYLSICLSVHLCVTHSWFLFYQPISLELFEVWPVPSVNFWGTVAILFTGQTPFLSPNQPCQSMEGWNWYEFSIKLFNCWSNCLILTWPWHRGVVFIPANLCDNSTFLLRRFYSVLLHDSFSSDHIDR